MPDPNRLYFGDCLDVMREDVADESIDLIYLDPPFNPKRLYNAFIGGAQWVAFDDTWRWHEAIDDFDDVVGKPSALADTMEGMRRILGEGTQLAYLSYMANRLRECRRVLRPDASIYLHCDPTMSHYLKVVMDGVFEAKKAFRNEIVWCYAGGGRPRKDFARKHDIVFRYSTGRDVKFNRDPIRIPYQAEGLRRTDASMWGRHKGTDRVYGPHPLGKVPEDWWPIRQLNANSPERLGYPTQKPLALLERIVKASSNPGDIVA